MYHPWRAFRAQARWVLEQSDLPERHLGQVDFIAGRVTLHAGLSQAQRRCTICHELIHLERGPVPQNPWMKTHEEAFVAQEAARRLITLEDLAAALQWSRDPTEVAEELWVDEDTLQTRLAHLTDAEQAWLVGHLS